jgi:ATP-dependent DNA helicase RecQ
LNHVVEVLTGAETERVRKWGHEQLSTYGIGRERGRPEWMAIGRELLRLGLVRQRPDKFNVLELTPAGRDALKQRAPIRLTKPVVAPEAPAQPRIGEIACDEALFDRLLALRGRLAVGRGVPPYIIFSDVALRQMARRYPASERDFARISGVGETKLREFGAVFLAEIAEHLRRHPRQMFADDSFTGSSASEALHEDALPYDGESFKRLRQARLELANERGLPAYCILHDSALRRIARARPTTAEELGRIKGVGPRRAAEFGERLLAAVREPER